MNCYIMDKVCISDLWPDFQEPGDLKDLVKNISTLQIRPMVILGTNPLKSFEAECDQLLIKCCRNIPLLTEI